MLVQEITLEMIDFADERYRMSYFRDPSTLRPSIAAVGLLNPPWLWQAEEGAPYTILCGYQRLRVCQDLRYQRVPARLYRADQLPALDAFRINLFDNLTIRPFHAIEKAAILQRLRVHFGLPGPVVVSQYHRLLGLPPQRAVLEEYLQLLTLPTAMQEALVQDRLSLPIALRMGRGTRADAEALFRVITELRLGVNRQRELLDWSEEIARTRGWTLARVLQQPEIAAQIDAEPSPPAQRAEQVRRLLHAQRFPRLTQQEARFQSQVPSLGLGAGMRLTHDPLFEDARLKIEFPFASAAELRAAGQTLLALAENPALRNLLDLL